MDDLDLAILELEEAVKRGATKAKAERLVRPLELALRKAFKAQGAMFARKLRVLHLKFSETVVKRGGDDPFASWNGMLQYPIRESITPADWLVIWYEVARATDKLLSEPIDKAVEKALSIGALAQIAALGLGIKWEVSNPLAQAYLEQYGADLVTGIDGTTRDYMNTLLNQAMTEGWSYQKTAEAIIERFNEFAIGKPQEHIDSRAHLIAVTEMGNAFAEGNLQIAKDLAAAGIAVEKAWDTVGDDKVSEGCKANEAEGWIDVNEAFSSGDQRPLRFPGCRCDLLTRVKKE